MTATAHELGVSSPRRKTRWVLVALELVIAINAVGGSIWGLSGAKDVPREWLDGTPFDSYVVPSLILLVGVGGGMSAAAAALALRHPLARRRAPRARSPRATGATKEPKLVDQAELPEGRRAVRVTKRRTR